MGPFAISPLRTFAAALLGAALAVSSADPLRAQEQPALALPPGYPEPPAVPDSIAIPRFDEPAREGMLEVITESETMDILDVEAVEIPDELLGFDFEGKKEEEAAEAMAENADVEEAVDAKDSIVEIMRDVVGTAPVLRAEDLRATYATREDGRLGSSLLTRTEARTFNFSVPAPRGQILDRNGYPLAQNKVAHYAAITFPFLGAEISDDQILRYAAERILHVNELMEFESDSLWTLSADVVLRHYKNRRWLPLTFSAVLDDTQKDLITRNPMEGLTLHPIYLRHYPQGARLAHVVGYVGKRPPRVLGEIVPDEALWGDGMGVDGLEESFDAELRGKAGRINVLFEADGSKVKEDVLIRPQPGFNVVTSIDLEMQRICEDLLAERVKRGAIVIMDVRNGDIMAMASYPQFDPNDFIPSISQEKYSELISDPEKPLFPRAFRAGYPPASTFKTVSALGFLESGRISANSLFPCPTTWRVGDLVMRNWNEKGEGSMNVVRALSRSCNTWFYEVSVRAGSDSMSSMALRLGLGMKTGIPLNEAEGFIPTNRWHVENLGYRMSSGENAVMSIGQGRVETTPLQIAKMMAAVGNGRHVMKPRLILQVQDLNHEIVRSVPEEIVNHLNVDGYALRTVQRGLYDTVNGAGTGGSARHKITVSGKTGTGQWKPALKQNIAWFAGYFPSKYPIYSISVIYEGDPGERVGGSANAAPIVGEFLNRYLDEDNYNRVRDMANALKEDDDGELDQFSYREAQPESIFHEEGEPLHEEAAAHPQTEAPAQQRPSQGRGIFSRIFGGGRD